MTNEAAIPPILAGFGAVQGRAMLHRTSISEALHWGNRTRRSS